MLSFCHTILLGSANNRFLVNNTIGRKELMTCKIEKFNAIITTNHSDFGVGVNQVEKNE